MPNSPKLVENAVHRHKGRGRGGGLDHNPGQDGYPRTRLLPWRGGAMAVGPDMGVARFAAAKFALEKVPDLRPVMRRYDTLSIGAALIVASISFLVSAAAVATGMDPATASVVVAVLVTATAAGALLSLMAWLQSELQRVLTPAYNAFVEWRLELEKTGVRGVAGAVTASTWLEFLLGRIEGSTKWLEILIAAAGPLPAAAGRGGGGALAGGAQGAPPRGGPPGPRGGAQGVRRRPPLHRGRAGPRPPAPPPVPRRAHPG